VVPCCTCCTCCHQHSDSLLPRLLSFQLLTPEQPFNCVARLVALSIHFLSAAFVFSSDDLNPFKFLPLFIVPLCRHAIAGPDPEPPDRIETRHTSLSAISTDDETRIELVIPYHKRLSLRQRRSDLVIAASNTALIQFHVHATYNIVILHHHAVCVSLIIFLHAWSQIALLSILAEALQHKQHDLLEAKQVQSGQHRRRPFCTRNYLHWLRKTHRVDKWEHSLTACSSHGS